ncbi:hypothetical protein DM860_005349 [Cuscuta australis]|uniref:Membrane insertase YidC/Oxa/ALB C-terminal domain-containing protein n=1 Tax=Cuscuta australis TaxID=267555 RepID=A0A328E3F0_9ASTE|nr:hypothetical protein DM860_005349 [Cuscuta australis]
MAYRRSVITRAKHFYEQQRFAQTIPHIYCEDDRRKPESSLHNPRILSDLQSCYFGNRVNSVGGSVRKLFPSQLMVPMSLGVPFVRNMSTSVGEGVDKMEYMSDVAGVLSDKAVEAVASQAPAVMSEVAIAASDSFLPVAALQYVIDYVHCFTGLNWWSSIVCTTLLIRWLSLPLMIHQLKATSRLAVLKPKLDEIREEMQNKGMSPSAVNDGREKMNALFIEHKVTPFTALKGIFIQGPVFVCFFLAVRMSSLYHVTLYLLQFLEYGFIIIVIPLQISNMAEKVPSFKEGGAFWFTDLTTPDSMYIFPILTALTFWITVECNAMEGMEGNSTASTIKNVSRVFAALTIPFTASFPKAIFCYWIISNLFSLMYGLVIKKPQVKKLLGVPIIPPAPRTTDPKPAVPFFEALKKYAAAQEYAAKQATQQISPLPTKAPKTSTRPSSPALSHRIRALEKEVKGKKKGKKRR